MLRFQQAGWIYLLHSSYPVRTIPNGQNNLRLVAVDRFLSLLGGIFSRCVFKSTKPYHWCHASLHLGWVLFTSGFLYEYTILGLLAKVFRSRVMYKVFCVVLMTRLQAVLQWIAVKIWSGTQLHKLGTPCFVLTRRPGSWRECPVSHVRTCIMCTMIHNNYELWK